MVNQLRCHNPREAEHCLTICSAHREVRHCQVFAASLSNGYAAAVARDVGGARSGDVRNVDVAIDDVELCSQLLAVGYGEGVYV